MRRSIEKRSDENFDFSRFLCLFFYSQTDTGLSIRFSTSNSTWFRLYLDEQGEHFGQFTTFVNENSSQNFSNVSIRIDENDLKNVLMPYYLCISNRNQTGCVYLRENLVHNKTSNGIMNDYFLREVNGKLFTFN